MSQKICETTYMCRYYTDTFMRENKKLLTKKERIFMRQSMVKCDRYVQKMAKTRDELINIKINGSYTRNKSS
jgi:hypothetical protein